MLIKIKLGSGEEKAFLDLLTQSGYAYDLEYSPDVAQPIASVAPAPASTETPPAPSA